MIRFLILTTILLVSVSCRSLYEAESIEIAVIKSISSLPFQSEFTLDGTNRNPWLLDFSLNRTSQETPIAHGVKLTVTIYNVSDERVPYPFLRGRSLEELTPSFLDKSESAKIEFELVDYASINLCPGASSMGNCAEATKTDKMRYKIVLNIEGPRVPPEAELRINVRDVPATL